MSADDASSGVMSPPPVQVEPSPSVVPPSDSGSLHSSRKHPAHNLAWLLAAIVIILILGASYLFWADTHPNTADKMQPVSEKPPIKLAVNPWKASELNATIAKIILEEKMGFPVELVPIDENAQWQSLSQGDIHASLEVWPSGHKENITTYIETEKTVENGGLLGPAGKIGWYVPKYLINDHPELATWEGFKNPKNVALFAADSEGKGEFYTGDPTWTQYDDQIIKNLGLDFEVKVLGSEEALIQLLDERYTAKKPIVFYLWTPHWAHAVYDLASVELPPYTDECYADIKSGVNCDYPKDELLKVFSADLKTYSPEAYQFLRKFNYSNEDQIRMLAALQQKKQTTDEVATNWVRNNEAAWQLWIP